MVNQKSKSKQAMRLLLSSEKMTTHSETNFSHLIKKEPMPPNQNKKDKHRRNEPFEQQKALELWSFTRLAGIVWGL